MQSDDSKRREDDERRRALRREFAERTLSGEGIDADALAEVRAQRRRQQEAMARADRLLNVDELLNDEQWASASFEDLPGAELVAGGVRDLRAGQLTANALLVACAATRLRAAGIDVPAHTIADPDRDLYRVLSDAAAGDAGAADPYSTYNALLRRLVSFCEAVEAAARRRRDSAKADELVDRYSGSLATGGELRRSVQAQRDET